MSYNAGSGIQVPVEAQATSALSAVTDTVPVTTSTRNTQPSTTSDSVPPTSIIPTTTTTTTTTAATSISTTTDNHSSTSGNTTPNNPQSSTTTTLDHITTSSTTTGPHTIPTTSNPDGSPTSNTVTYTQSSKIITTSSAIPIITVTRSGASTFTVVSTSYSMYTTSVPTNISEIEQPSSVNSSAIAGGVVGGVAFIVLIGIIGFFVLRKKNPKKTTRDQEIDVALPPERYGSPTFIDSRPTSIAVSRPFIPAYDPSKDDFSVGQYSYDGGYYTQQEPTIRNVPDEVDHNHRLSRHVPDEKT
ncbi:hypothetical protein RMCBS344292_11486 [Rhizopus microsporus]|nr:hypothetical protein RMCBS344292_11486 [Rhizopus microsporus]